MDLEVIVPLVMKSFGGLAWPTLLRTRSTRVLVVVVTCAEGPRYGSSGRLCSLSYCMALSVLRRIMGYRWFDHVTNWRLLRETGSRPIVCTIRQRQLRLYGHAARFPQVNPAYRAVFERYNPGWRRPRGRPQSSWLGKVDESCWDVLGMGRRPACRLALILF